MSAAAVGNLRASKEPGATEALVGRIRAAVNDIHDPCSVSQGVPAGLVDMGLLCDVQLGPLEGGRYRALVAIRLTGPGCFYGIYFEREIRVRLEAMAEIGAIDVEFSSEFDWTPDDVAPHIQQRLRIRREQLIAELPIRSKASAP